jgi:protein gp37
MRPVRGANAEKLKRKRVFCASMADVFERRSELNEPRLKLWKLIGETPYLDWLLLTKRPQNIESMVPWTGQVA